ncbi:hypothetical protein O6V14_05335 [Sphingomonas faeni]|uniref:HTH domain-containing protein n=1 Tax=Sphingomonas faeni TaxID=185950 RepID=UPI003354DDB7
MAEDRALEDVGVYVFDYKTGFFSGNYSLGDAVDALKEYLKFDRVVSANGVLFVCHSMGGIVVRRYLVSRAVELIERDIPVAVFLVASPSLGSDYANLVAPLARQLGHSQGAALRFSQSNAWLNDLDRDFINMREQRRLRLAGKELIEDRSIVLRKWLRKQVVEPFSGARYFGDPIKVPDSDHFSIAKIPDGNAFQHSLLRRFIIDWRSSLEAAFEDVPNASGAIANCSAAGESRILHAVYDVGERVAEAFAPLPTELLDAAAASELETLRRGRFYQEVDQEGQALRLAARLDIGELSRASDAARAAALATCARHLAGGDHRMEAERLLAISTALAATEEAVNARAVLLAADDADAGLTHLAPIDNPGRRLVALIILARTRSGGELVDWAEAAGIGSAELDSDGRHVLLYARVEDGRWDAAYSDASALTAEDLAATPAIGQVAAVARLARAVPKDLRHILLNGVPLDPIGFPLSDTVEGVEERRFAIELAKCAGRQASELGASEAAGHVASIALWLELRDPELHKAAAARLDGLLDGAGAIRWIPLALAFGLIRDVAPVEAAVHRAATLNPQGSAEIALARLTLAMSKPTPGESADYLSAHRGAFTGHLDDSEVARLEIGMLIEAGRTADAGERLTASARILDHGMVERLREQIDSGEAGATLAQLEAAHAADPSTANLAQLVGALSRQGYSERLFELARRLLAATRSLATAEGLVMTLQKARKWDQVSTVLAEIPDLINQSIGLRNANAWDAYRRGQLAAVETSLRSLPDDPSTRALRHNLLLVSGRWPDIARLVEDEWTKRDQRSAKELLDLARLAQQVGSGRVRDLIALAVAKAPGDPHVLAGGYLLGTQAGLDDTTETHSWLERAAALSGEDGPIQRADLADLVAGQPEWDRRTADIQEQLRSGVLPLFLAAALLRRPSLELRLAAMIGNQRESDPRRRTPVPAFSGLRGRVDGSPATLGLDGSALTTLGALGLVETVVARSRVSIPHNTLGWLFQERQRLAFHQPSRIAFAHRLQRELGTGRMARFAPSALVDGKLADTIGSSLASMIASAGARPEGTPQRLVVRSAPVQRVGAFRGEAVDMVAHAGTLCSCQTLVDALEDRGQLAAAQARHARTFLEVNEERWPHEPAVEDEAELYLDDLSVSLLDTAGVLGALHGAGFRVHVSEREVDEANALIDLEAQSAEIEKVIEHVRSALATGIVAGSVTLFPLADEEDEVRQHPDLRVVDFAGHVDAIVSDDRSINRVRQIDGPAGSSPVWTSLDVLVMLHAEDLITQCDLVAHRTTLRRNGLVLFPTDTEELSALIAVTHLREGEMLETGELRALRENLQLALMRRYLKLPEEAEYLQVLSRAVIETLILQWTNAIPDDVARARSRWLLARADMRDWVAAMPDGRGDGIASHGQAIPITTLIAHHLDVEGDARGRFDAWLEEEVIGPLRHREPAVHAWLMNQTRAMIVALGEDAQDE